MRGAENNFPLWVGNKYQLANICINALLLLLIPIYVTVLPDFRLKTIYFTLTLMENIRSEAASLASLILICNYLHSAGVLCGLHHFAVETGATLRCAANATIRGVFVFKND